MTRRRLFKKEYAKELLNIAENDLLAARALFLHPEVRRETVLLHVQQSIEKSLKACLAANAQPIPMTHDLMAIVQLFEPHDAPPYADDIEELTSYATVRRYEEGRYALEDEDIQAAFAAAEAIIAWSHNKLASQMKE